MDFVRDRLTVYLYLLLGFFMLSRSLLAPFVSYRSSETPDQMAVIGFHITLSSIGILMVGLTWGKISNRYSEKKSIVISSLALALGCIGLASQELVITLTSAFILGAAGSVLNISIHALLADRHRENKKIAIGEAAVVSSIFGALPPLLVSYLQTQTNLGWRWSLIAPALLLTLVSLVYRSALQGLPSQAPPGDQPSSSGSKQRVRGVFWCWLVLLLFCVATEWCVIYWSSSLLEKVGGYPINYAVLSVSFIIFFQIFGRACWTAASRKRNVETLLKTCLTLTLIGVTGFYIGTLQAAPTALVAAFLLLFALGISGTGQFTTVKITEMSEDRAKFAMSSISAVSGASVLLFPWLMGAQAQYQGIATAFITPLCCSLLALLLASYLSASSAGKKPRPARAGKR